MLHSTIDQVSLEMAQRIAGQLSRRPEWLVLAHRNLDRSTQRNRDSAWLVRCSDKWRTLLDGSLDDVVRVLTGMDDESVRLRHNSPCVGILAPRDVWAITRRFRDEEGASARARGV